MKIRKPSNLTLLAIVTILLMSLAAWRGTNSIASEVEPSAIQLSSEDQLPFIELHKERVTINQQLDQQLIGMIKLLAKQKGIDLSKYNPQQLSDGQISFKKTQPKAEGQQ